MIEDIAALQIAGISLIRIFGIITYLSFVFTALISISNKRGWRFVDFKWHPRIAIISLILATIHALLVVILYL